MSGFEDQSDSGEIQVPLEGVKQKRDRMCWYWFLVEKGWQRGEGGSRGSLAVVGVIQAGEEKWVRLSDRGMERNECIWDAIWR